MRKETQAVMSAFIRGEACTRARTTIDGDNVYLHGHRIAWREGGKVFGTLAGWGSATTRERLNGLCVMLTGRGRFGQRNYEQMFDGKPVGVRDVLLLKD